MQSSDLLRGLRRLVLDPWITLWRSWTPPIRRYLKMSALTLLLLVTTSGAAHAEGSDAPSVMSWIKIKDSHGISIFQYEMSLDRGGVTAPGKMVWSVFVDLAWEFYRACVAFAAWMIDWTLSFQWLTWISQPAQTLGDSLQAIVDRFGATPTLLTITAFVAAVWIARGKWSLGIFELCMSLVIASVATGALADPVDKIAGQDGLLVNARDLGLEVATGLNNNGNTNADPEEMRKELSGTVVDAFLRVPQQLVNFGKVLDEGECKDVYQEKVKDGPYGGDSDLRDAIKQCNEKAGKVAENPNSSMLGSAVVLQPAGLILLLFAAALSMSVLISGIYAVAQALKLIIDLVVALLPGGSRGGLWMSLAEVVIAMLMIVASTVFLSVYLLLLESFFTGATNPMMIFFIIDVLLAAGLIVYWKFRNRIKASAERLARVMAQRPGGAAPVALPTPQPSGMNLGRVAHGAMAAGHVVSRLRIPPLLPPGQPRPVAAETESGRQDSPTGAGARGATTTLLAATAAAATGGASAAAAATARPHPAGHRRAALESRLRALPAPKEAHSVPSATSTALEHPRGGGALPTPRSAALPSSAFDTPGPENRVTPAPRVVQGEVVSTHQHEQASAATAARLKARLEERRTAGQAIALPVPARR